MEVAVLCGGRGLRMGSIADRKQKCILEIDGKPMLGYVLDNIADAFGKAKVYMLTAYRGSDIFDVFGSQYRNLELEYIERETGGIRLALLDASNNIRSSFLKLGGGV